MKITHALAAASLAVIALSGCEVPEDGGTAADSAEVNQKKPAKGKTQAAATKKEKAAPKETTGQENAREAAENYLDFSAFSRTGLIKQLKFEGYAEKDAVYGVDAQKADWMKQAAAKGEEYLEMSPFSRQGLIDQLKFEGFTEEQAAHGAAKNGL
jgi:hypothetical protein